MRRRANCGRRGPIVVFVVATVTAASASAVRDAPAQEDAEPIRLAYRASAGCPEEASFIARIRQRTKRARLAWTGEPARTFTIVVEAGPPPSGSVAVQAGDESQGTRLVRADTCSDVADALALVVALAIDPRATIAPAPAAPPVAVPSPPPPPKPRPRVGAPAVDAAAFFAGADLVFATGVAPKLLIGGSPYVGWRAASATLLQPSVRLALLRIGSGALNFHDGNAEFTWTVGRLDVCPIVWPRGFVRVTECVRAEAGTLEVTRADVTSLPSHSRPWLAVGPLVRAEWWPLAWAFVDAEVAGLIRVIQDRYRFNASDPTPFYEVPPIGVTTGVGVGVRFF